MSNQQIKPNVYCRNDRCGYPLAKCVHAWIEGLEGMGHEQFTYWVKTYDGAMIWELPDGTKQKSIWPPDNVGQCIAKLFRWDTRFKAATQSHRHLPDTPQHRAHEEYKAWLREMHNPATSANHNPNLPTAEHIDHPALLDEEAAELLLPPGTSYSHFAPRDPRISRQVNWHVTVKHDNTWTVKHATILYGMISLDHGQRVRCPKCRRVQPLEWTER